MRSGSEGAAASFWSDVDDDGALQRYRALVDVVDTCVYQLDAGGQFVAVDDALVDLTGYDREALLGSHVSLVLADDAERVESAVTGAPASNGDGRSSFELQIRTASGRTVPCELRLQSLQEDDEVVGTVGTAQVRSGDAAAQDAIDPARPSTESIAAVLDEAGVGVVVLDADFEVAWADETVAEYFGCDRNDLVGRDERSFVDELDDVLEDPDGFADRVLEAHRDDAAIQRFECRVTSGDGREGRWLEHWSRPIESGQYAGGRLQLYTDVTDRRHSEDALRETEARFQSLVDAVEEYAIFRLDPEGTVISWNRGARKIKGYDAEEILGEHFSTFYTGADREAGVPERNLERALETGSVEDEDWRVRADGSEFWASVTITPVFDDGGTHAGFLKVTRDATDRYERERELETRLQRVFGRVSDAFYAVDDEFRFTHVNERAEELLDRSEEELLDERLWDVFPSAADIDEVWDAFHAALESQDPTSYEMYYDQLGFWVEAHLYPSETGISVYFRDVTEQKGRERELEKYETIVETVDDGIYVKDAEGRFTMVNEAYAELTGYDREELVGAPASLVVDEATIEGSREILAADDDAAGMPAMEAEIHRADGERVPAEGTFATIEAEDGSVEEVGVVRDVSARKERERELEKFETIVETVDDGIYVVDEDGCFTMVNEAYAELTGYDREELLGSHVSLLIDEETVQRVAEAEAEMAEGQLEEPVLEATLQRADGTTVPVAATFATLPGEEWERVGVARDVSEQREYRRKLEESNERLEQFAYAASHDLQEPLRMVSSYLQLIERRYADDLGEDGREFVEFAVDGADRMREMIEALLEYSRVETEGDPLEPVDLDAVVEDVLADLQLQIRETDAAVSVDSLPRVEGDASQLRQLFQNLLDNALTYAGEEPPSVHVSAERAGPRWRISVSDEGVGIDPDEQDAIFRVFQRLHSREEHEGTGIGLAICRRIVERHDGEIRVDADPGEGSTFTFTLPAAGGGDE